MSNKKELMKFVPARKKSAGKKVVKAVLAIAAINGVLYVLSKQKNQAEKKNESKNENSEIKVHDVFMNAKQIKVEDEFQGIVLKSVMSGVEIDLRNAIIKKDVYITCKNIMSGISIRVPAGVNVKLENKDILSGTDNAVPEYEGEEVPTIYIEAKSILSGLAIRQDSYTSKDKTRDEYVEEDMFVEVPSQDIIRNNSSAEVEDSIDSDVESKDTLTSDVEPKDTLTSDVESKDTLTSEEASEEKEQKSDVSES